MDETKIKARDRTYYLWLAVDEKGLPVFMHLSRRRDSWTAKLVLYNTKAISRWRKGITLLAYLYGYAIGYSFFRKSQIWG